MGRDKVIGLGLAVMLAGFAAAFCYRNDPFMEKGLHLARTKFLEEVIAGRQPQVAPSREGLQSQPLPEQIASKAPIERTEPPVSLNDIQQLDEPRTAPAIAEARPFVRQPVERTIERTEPTRIENPFETAEPTARPLDTLVSNDNRQRRSDPEPRMAANRPSPGHQLADRPPQRAQQIYVPTSSRRVRNEQPAAPQDDQAAMPPDYPDAAPKEPTIMPNAIARRPDATQRDRPTIVPEGVQVEEPAGASNDELRVIPREIAPFQSQRLVPETSTTTKAQNQQDRHGPVKPPVQQSPPRQDVEELPPFQLDGN